jgi:predicted AAA+ superfamily ATPase
MDVPYKFIVSGSGSIDLKAKIRESMVGRKRVYELSPVSLKEFVNFRTDYKYEDRFDEFIALRDAGLEQFLLDVDYKILLMEFSICNLTERGR